MPPVRCAQAGSTGCHARESGAILMGQNETSRNVEQDRSVVYAFTATPKAIERFRQALIYAESAVHGRVEQLYE